MKNFLLSIALILFVTTGLAQVSLSNATVASQTATINFSNTMQTGVGTNASTAYTGAGFSPAPTAASFPGRLNSNAWETKGWANGNLLFGQNMTNPAHGRGSVTSAVITEGIYAYTDNPASVANPTLMIQPGDDNFAPGSLTLRIKNNGTANLTQLQVSYNLFVRNDANSSSTFNFSHSFDNVTFEEEPSMDYTSPETADAFQWTMVDIAPTRTMVITGINVAPGGFYYIRWSSEDVVVNGERDEFGLDDIVLTGFYGPPAPEINVMNNSLSILNQDFAPQIADGTIFANTFTGGSSSLVTFRIQNLGGADLNISDIFIYGTNPGDFTIQGVTPLGNIPGVSSVVSFFELTIKFTPLSPGQKNARIQINSNDSNENPYQFAIRGTGVIPQPDIQVNGDTAPNTSIIFSTNMIPSTFNGTLFDPQQIGGPGQLKQYKIRNTGDPSFLILGPDPAITITGLHPNDFVIETYPNGNSISAGYFKTFTIRFNPLAPGIRQAIVKINNNDVVNDVLGNDESPFTFLIQGTGVSPEADLFGNGQPIANGSTVPTLANHTYFGNANINSGFIDRTFTISNPGTMPLTVGAMTITGSSAFSVQTPPAASVPTSGTTTFVIRFDPSAIGNAQATVTFANNDSDENPYVFNIGGYGTDYIPCSTGPVETIALQDFEVTPPSPAWTYTFSGTNLALTPASAVAFGASTDGGQSNRFLGQKAMQLAGNTTPVSVTFDAVNTTDYLDLQLNLRLASMAVTASEGNDAADKVVVAVSTNNGTSWSNELEIRGSTNSKWSFESGSATATASYDGNNSAVIFAPVATSYVTDQGYSYLTLSNLPAVPQLRVRITMNNGSNEVWVIDDVALFGRREIQTTWNGTWSNGVPNSSVKAIINANYDTAAQGNLSACKCEIKNGRTVTIQANQHFNIESDFNNLGTINIENSGSLVQRNDFAQNAGIINVKRNTTPMRRFDYTYWSSPVQGQTLFNLSPLTPSDKFWQFSSAINNWDPVPSSTIMVPGKGYIVRAPQNFSTTIATPYNAQFSGLANNGYLQFPIIGGGAWNLLGNPYPSAMDADEFIQFDDNANIIGGTLYFWTHNTPLTANAYNNNDYASYNMTGGTGTAASTSGNTSIPSGMIASGQGFFVTGTQNGHVTFNNSMRVTGSNSGFFRPANEFVATPAAATGIEKHRIWLDLFKAEGVFKQALVGYIEGDTNGIDRNYDGIQLDGGNGLGFYSILEDQHMGIQGRALPFYDTDFVPMGYSSISAGQFTIAIDRTDGLFTTQGIYLEDNVMGTVHDLKAAPYVFTTDAGEFNQRFVLRFTGSALSMGDNYFGSGLQMAVRDSHVHFKSARTIDQVDVFDLTGRRVLQQQVNDSEGTITKLQVTQSYIVKFTFADGTVENRKIILN